MALASPDSRLTLERPDIWQRGLTLATGLTGYAYLPKLPLPDGTIFACGGGGYYPPPKPPTPEEIKKRKHNDELHRRQSEINHLEWMRGKFEQGNSHTPGCKPEIWDYITPEEAKQTEMGSDRRVAKLLEPIIKKKKEQLERFRKQSTAPSVLVPDGAMEWLLHEVGHWIAASPAERRLPNYGDGHELEAWAFEDIIFEPFGPARGFAPLTQRDGTAFQKAGPIPAWAFGHIDRRLREDHIDVDPFRLLWAEWVRWGTALGRRAPWRTES